MSSKTAATYGTQMGSKHSVRVALLKSHLSGKGGLEKVTRGLAEAFSEAGAQVYVLTTGTPTETSHNYHVVTLGQRSKWSWRHLKRYDTWCQSWLKKSPCDIVFGLDRNSNQSHYRAGNGVHAAYLEKRRLTDSAPKYFSFRWNPQHRLILQLEKRCYENPYLQQLFTNSHMVRKEILQHYAIASSKIQVVHNGVEWSAWEPPFMQWIQQREQHINSHGLDPKSYQLLFVGNGYQRKGLGLLLDALAPLAYRDFQLSVVGKDKQIKRFKDHAHHLGLAHRIHFFGPQNDLIPFYQAADALAIPSTYDPFANVTVEGLAMGLHVLSSRENGGHEVITEESGTIIEDLRSHHSLRKALLRTLDRPKTPISAKRARASVQHLELQSQLNRIVRSSLQ